MNFKWVLKPSGPLIIASTRQQEALSDVVASGVLSASDTVEVSTVPITRRMFTFDCSDDAVKQV